MSDFKYSLGQTVADDITGYEGVIICRTQWLTGCNNYGVKSRELKDGKPLGAEHFDELQLKLVPDKKEVAPQVEAGKKPGGPREAPQRTNRF